jgi:hypothetical protein
MAPAADARDALVWRRQIRLPSLPAPDLAAGAVLLAAVLFLFQDAVFGDRVFYYRDIHLQWQPQTEAFVRSIAAGSWPLWNPDRCFGQPLLANPNTQILYPPTWLNLVIKPWTYYTLYVVGHVLLCGVGVYALGRRLGLSRPASLLAGTLTMASGPLLSLTNLWNHLAGAAWVPWIVLAADAACTTRKAADAALWGAALAAPVFAGSLEAALVGSALVVGCCWPRLEAGSAFGPHNRRLAFCALAAVLMALALSASQWLPSLELAGRSARASLPLAVRTSWSIHPSSLVEAVLPVRLDDLPFRNEVRAALFESRESFLHSLYLGLAALGLVVTAVVSGPRKGLARGLAVVALCGLALSLGKHTPVYGLVEALVPPLKSLRYPAKAILLPTFAWALLAGIGLDELVAQVRARGERAVLLCEAAMAAILALAGTAIWLLWSRTEELGSALLSREITRRPFGEVFAPDARRVLVGAGLALGLLLIVFVRQRLGKGYGIALLLVAAADPLAAHRDLTPYAARELYTFAPAALASAKKGEHSRVYVYDYFDAGKGERYLGHPRFAAAVRQEDWAVPWEEALGLRAYLFPSVVGNWGLESAYANDSLGLFSQDLHRMNRLLRAVEGTATHLRLLRMGGVSRVVSLHAEGFESMPLLATYPTFFPERMFVFAVPDPLPRTYAVDGVRVASGNAALAALKDPGFDPTREILLPGGLPRPADASFSASSRILEWKPDGVRLEASLSGIGYVVLLDGYDPGRHATLDGRAVPVLEANLAFRAVQAPAGRHVIEFRYEPTAVTAGLAVSVLAALAGLIVILPRRASATDS